MTSQLISDLVCPSSFFGKTNYGEKFTEVEKTGNLPQRYEFTVEDFLVYVAGKIAGRCRLVDYDPLSGEMSLEGYSELGIKKTEVNFIFSLVKLVTNEGQLTTRQISYLNSIVSPTLIRKLDILEDEIVDIKNENTKNGYRKTVKKVKEVVYIGNNSFCIRYPYDPGMNKNIRHMTTGYCIELGGHIGSVSNLTVLDIDYLKKQGFVIDSIVLLGRQFCSQEEETVVTDCDEGHLIAYSNNGVVGDIISILMETGNL